MIFINQYQTDVQKRELNISMLEALLNNEGRKNKNRTALTRKNLKIK